MTRPAHLDPALVAVVAAGGALGTAARYGLSTSIGGSGGWPTATFVENVVGAFLLGVLLEALVRRGPESTRTRAVRLGLGTGLLGGFTTVSGLAVEMERLLADGSAMGVVYGGVSVVVGLAACMLGVALAARHHDWRSGRLPRDPDAAELLPRGDGTGESLREAR